MSKRNPKRSGGPRSEAGKASSSRNALNTGIAVDYWIDSSEQEEYDMLVAGLTAEYAPVTVTVQLLIDRLATKLVKLHRMDRVENAMHQRARITSEHVARQQADTAHSLASYLPATAAGRNLALRVAAEDAMPDPERLTTVTRYQAGLERQISRLVADIRRVTTENRRQGTGQQALGEVTTGPLLAGRVGEAQIEDATMRGGPTAF